MASQDSIYTAYDADNWAWQTKAVIDHDIYKQFNGSIETTINAIQAQTLIVVAKQDLIVNPTPALELAEQLDAPTLVFDNTCGHQFFACPSDTLAVVMRNFLEDNPE
ncbi:MAG: hypothetical protein IH987_07440 [Planctomycetes bacterium]|nr:hypothetical protein [Planctomycetota bacterium]